MLSQDFIRWSLEIANQEYNGNLKELVLAEFNARSEVASVGCASPIYPYGCSPLFPGTTRFSMSCLGYTSKNKKLRGARHGHNRI